ncbi:MAG TPA: MerR family transcriptional regulator [Longimicrobiales bacterium]|nr:MerR family transcriptional regulator [Longimicrobiales bacterium]
MEWSIQEIARLAGTTSRTLRHYGAIGLLPPSRVGNNGYRYYDAAALVRLQRILLLREMGLGLADIAEVLEGHRDDIQALRLHLEELRRERSRLDDRMESVEITIARLERGEALMAEEMLNGFDHTKYRDEVVDRWGNDAYERSDRWWQGLSQGARSAWMARSQALGADWAEAARSGAEPDGAEGQALAQRQADWLAGIPGTPRDGTRPSKEYFLGLAEMYVADERFAANYGGRDGAAFVRDAMKTYAERNL